MLKNWRILLIFMGFLAYAYPHSASIAKTASERSFDFYESALTLFDREDYRGAIIQLRNSLQQDPQNIPARVLFGKAYLRLGDGAGAEKQLLFARTSGADESLVVIPLGRAYLVQAKNKELLAEIRKGNRQPEIEAEVRFLRGQAYMNRHQLVRAEASFKEALELHENHPTAVLGMARLRQTQGRDNEAEAWVDRAIKISPEDADAYYVKGEILRTRTQYDKAIEYYDKAIAIADRHLPARTSRAASLLDTGKDKEALEDILYVRAELPNDPKTAYLHALILFREKKYREAEIAVRDAAASMDGRDPEFVINHPPSLLLRGSLSYALRRFDEAYPYLVRYIEMVPVHSGARKMLGAIQLRRNEPKDAAKTLKTAIRLDPTDTDIMVLLGNAYMRTREYNKAVQLFEKAASLAESTIGIRTRLAMARLALGQRERGIEELSRIVDESKELNRAAIVLGMLHINSGKLKDAIAVADLLKEKFKDNPFPYNLAGSAYMNAKKNTLARREFEKAIELGPLYTPALYNLAALDIREQKIEKARQSYLDILKKLPTESRAMLELSQLAEGRGDLETAIRWLSQIRKLDLNSVRPMLKLVDFYLRTGRQKDALILANELEEKNPRNANILEAKARALIATGQSAKAIETYRHASTASSSHPRVLLRIGASQMRLRDFEGARASFKNAIALEPKYLPAHQQLIALEAKTVGVEKALEMARAIEQGYPKSPMGNLLVGDLLMQKKDYSKAIESYQAALKKGNSSAVAIRLYHAKSKAGQRTEAIRFLENWNEKNPGRVAILRVLALGYVHAGLIEKATLMHEAYLFRQPNDPAMLNNLATLYLKKNDRRALPTAKKAWDMRPEQPAVLDTYGWALVKYSDPSKGLRYLRLARTRASNQPEIGYHIAEALYRLGRDSEAKRELVKILNSGKTFSEAEDARRLLAKINRQL